MDNQIIGAFGAALLVGLQGWWDERKAEKAKKAAEAESEDSFAVVTLVPPPLLTYDKSAGSGSDTGDRPSG